MEGLDWREMQSLFCFARVSQAASIQVIWTEFREIHHVLRSTAPMDKDGVKSLEDHVRKSTTLFLSVYRTKSVTPCTHLLVSHIPQFLEIYGTIAPFSQQGPEKLNDDLTKDYFRSTNHWDWCPETNASNAKPQRGALSVHLHSWQTWICFVWHLQSLCSTCE